MERGSGNRSLNHLTDEHWDFPTDLTDSHGRVSHRFRRFTRILFRWIDKNYSHADFADYADCQLINLCSSVSLRLTKTDIHPLKSMEAELSVMLLLLSYKSKLLTPKEKA